VIAGEFVIAGEALVWFDHRLPGSKWCAEWTRPV
jgi:hypothetical protein